MYWITNKKHPYKISSLRDTLTYNCWSLLSFNISREAHIPIKHRILLRIKEDMIIIICLKRHYNFVWIVPEMIPEQQFFFFSLTSSSSSSSPNSLPTSLMPLVLHTTDFCDFPLPALVKLDFFEIAEPTRDMLDFLEVADPILVFWVACDTRSSSTSWVFSDDMLSLSIQMITAGHTL